MKLVLFKVNQLGDNVVFLPIVQTLRRLYPDWELALFTSPAAADLYAGTIPPARLWVEVTKDFNGEWKRPDRLWKLWRWLRDFGADGSLIGFDQGNVVHLLAHLAGGRVRAGADILPLKLPSALTHPVGPPKNARAGTLSWEVARVLVTACGGREWPASPPRPDLSHLVRGTTAQARRIVIHAGASRAYKRWPLERFQELARRLAADFEVVWIASPEASHDGLAGVRVEHPRDLSALTACIAGAGLFIGNNSGPMNLCIALGRPGVILNGPSNPLWDPVWSPERYLLLRDTALPCQPCDDCVRPAMECRNVLAPLTCLDRWSVDEVETSCRHWHERWASHSHC